MIILDTNVTSELMLGDARGDRRVLTWARGLGEQPVSTVINRAEIFSGITVLLLGERRTRLLSEAESVLGTLGPTLDLTENCALAYADIVAERRTVGRPIDTMDGLIAAIARTHGAGIATRNISDFDGLGLRLIDPWAKQPPDSTTL